jgi:hypothetical protein
MHSKKTFDFAKRFTSTVKAKLPDNIYELPILEYLP